MCQYHEAVSLLEQPSFDALRRLIEPSALGPNARVRIFFGEKPPDIKQQLRLVLRELPGDCPHQRRSMDPAVDDVESLLTEKFCGVPCTIQHIKCGSWSARTPVIC